jgi:hypothetical protein
MLRSRFLGLVALAGSLACARAQKVEPTATAKAAATKDGTAVASNDSAKKPGGKVVCTYEEPVGSHIPERVCYYQDDIDSTRAETQEFLRQNAAKQLSRGQ